MVRYFANFKPAEKTNLEYTIKEAENSLIFQVNNQSADITEFLKSNSYRASNGMLIASSSFPEFKDSDFTLFLRGDSKSSDYKLDVTRFASNMVRDKRKAQIAQAIRELVDFIKTSNSFVTNYRYSPAYAYEAPAPENFVIRNVYVVK
jgi:hypothetical protein